METKGINDATFRITLNKVKIDKFNSEDLKKYAEEIRDINVRFIKIKLKNGTIETLLTNLPKEIATPEELKQLYGDRLKIETNYDRLKNKTPHRKIHRKKENNHQTRLLQPHILI